MGKKRLPHHSRNTPNRSCPSLADIYSKYSPGAMGGRSQFGDPVSRTSTRTRPRTIESNGTTPPSGVMIFVTTKSLAPTKAAFAVAVRSRHHLGGCRADNCKSRKKGLAARDKCASGHGGQPSQVRAAAKTVEPMQRLARKEDYEHDGEVWGGEEENVTPVMRSSPSLDTSRLVTRLAPGSDSPAGREKGGICEEGGRIGQQFGRQSFRQKPGDVRGVGGGVRDDARWHRRTIRATAGKSRVKATAGEDRAINTHILSRARAITRLTDLHKVYGEGGGMSTSCSDGSPNTIVYPVVFGSNKGRGKPRKGAK